MRLTMRFSAKLGIISIWVEEFAQKSDYCKKTVENAQNVSKSVKTNAAFFYLCRKFWDLRLIKTTRPTVPT